MKFIQSYHQQTFKPAHETGTYCKCSKNSNSFLFVFTNKNVGFQGWYSQMLVRIANREDTVKAVWSGSALFDYAILAGN